MFVRDIYLLLVMAATLLSKQVHNIEYVQKDHYCTIELRICAIENHLCTSALEPVLNHCTHMHRIRVNWFGIHQPSRSGLFWLRRKKVNNFLFSLSMAPFSRRHVWPCVRNWETTEHCYAAVKILSADIAKWYKAAANDCIACNILWCSTTLWIENRQI